VSAVLAALVTNDTVCVFLTPIVVDLCLKHDLPMGPFLVGLATSANIGSTATPVGNPQNMIIASLSGISYGHFLLYCGPATVLSLIVELSFLYLMYRKQFANKRLIHVAPNPELQNYDVDHVGVAGVEMVDFHQHPSPTPSVSSHSHVGPVSESVLSLSSLPNPLSITYHVKSRKKLIAMTIVLAGTIVAFVAGAPLGWAAVAGAALMLCLDMRDPDATFKEVDWGLLVFFTSLFIVVKGFQKTGLPAATWSAAEDAIQLDRFWGVTLYSIIIIIGSNTVSNVPLVLLLANSIPQLANPKAGWLLLSFISTVAGNLTLVGSVANLIVVERAKKDYTLGFWEYFRFGFPSTLVVTFLGVAIMCAIL